MKKKKEVKLVKSLPSIVTFMKRKEKGLGGSLVNEQSEEHMEDIVEEHTNGNEIVDDLGHNATENDAEHNNNVNHADETSVNIFDSRVWYALDKNLVDLLVEKGPLRDLSIESAPPDKFTRRFSSRFYTRYLGNEEKYDREWLVYSKELDKVFCIC
ncbi:uncharacterized protein LOC126783841 [Argentina anserina]|uniref:uncharacterized protein LOC126783841 n=1 Tax=Argentina anserina TaxID=57926 RepID=UPI0021764285|nr:uncharacterized protein LOC126783841 [Potentilla anserina]